MLNKSIFFAYYRYDEFKFLFQNSPSNIGRLFYNCVNIWQIVYLYQENTSEIEPSELLKSIQFLTDWKKTFFVSFLLVSVDPDKSDNVTWKIRDEFINIFHICLIRIFCLFISKHSHEAVKIFLLYQEKFQFVGIIYLGFGIFRQGEMHSAQYQTLLGNIFSNYVCTYLRIYHYFNLSFFIIISDITCLVAFRRAQTRVFIQS